MIKRSLMSFIALMFVVSVITVVTPVDLDSVAYAEEGEGDKKGEEEPDC